MLPAGGRSWVNPNPVVPPQEPWRFAPQPWNHELLPWPWMVEPPRPQQQQQPQEQEQGVQLQQQQQDALPGEEDEDGVDRAQEQQRLEQQEAAVPEQGARMHDEESNLYLDHSSRQNMSSPSPASEHHGGEGIELRPPAAAAARNFEGTSNDGAAISASWSSEQRETESPKNESPSPQDRSSVADNAEEQSQVPVGFWVRPDDEEKWQARYRELEQYKERYGHLRIPAWYPQNLGLSKWLSNQRNQSLNENSSRKLKCKVTRKRRRLQLRSLGVVFPGDPVTVNGEDEWQTRYNELARFKKESGNVRVPFYSSANAALACWLMRQRFLYLRDDHSRRTEPTEVREFRRAKLEALGVTFPVAGSGSSSRSADERPGEDEIGPPAAARDHGAPPSGARMLDEESQQDRDVLVHSVNSTNSAQKSTWSHSVGEHGEEFELQPPAAACNDAEALPSGARMLNDESQQDHYFYRSVNSTNSARQSSWSRASAGERHGEQMVLRTPAVARNGEASTGESACLLLSTSSGMSNGADISASWSSEQDTVESPKNDSPSQDRSSVADTEEQSQVPVGPVVRTADEENWQARYSELEHYKERHGHVQIPKLYPPNQSLSNWLHKQRSSRLNENSSRKMKCEVTRKRQRLQLRSLGVVFAGDPDTVNREEEWQSRYRELVKFKVESGHVRVPFYSSANAALACWLMRQRFLYLRDDHSRHTEPTEVREFRRAKLEALGVTFPVACSVSGAMNRKRTSSKASLACSSVDRKRTHVLSSGDDDLKGLPEDTEDLRKEADVDGMRRASIEKKRVGSASTFRTLAWQLRYDELVKFKEVHGHVRVPRVYPPNQKLSNWLRYQRTTRLNDNSSQQLQCIVTKESRRKLLQSLGVEFPVPVPRDKKIAGQDDARSSNISPGGGGES